MSWITLLFAVELGFAPVYNSLNVTPDVISWTEDTSIGYVQMEAEAVMFDYIFVGGVMKTYVQTIDKVDNFHPFELDSLFNAGLRFGQIELGWRHLCLHPVRPYEIIYNTQNSTNAAYDEFYVRMEYEK